MMIFLPKEKLIKYFHKSKDG